MTIDRWIAVPLLIFFVAWFWECSQSLRAIAKKLDKIAELISATTKPVL